MSSLRVHRATIDSIPRLEPKEWRRELDRRLRTGERLVTLYGRPGTAEIVVTAVLQDAASSLQVLRTSLDPERGFHSLTPEFPSAGCFERELHEQHGVRIAGHPWLKPIRFEETGRAARDAYPFYRVEGKEVHEVAVGPIHAGVIEPGSFRFMCLGERVHHLEIHLGYQHRGVERLLLRGDPRRLAPLVETISGDASIAHAWAYCAAIESLGEIEVTLEIERPRGVLLELERIAMHLAGLSGMAADVGFLQGAATYGRLRTTAINTTMRLCGSRFGRSAMRPASLGAHLGHGEGASAGRLNVDELRRSLSLLRKDAAIIDDCFLAARTVQHRLHGVGQLTQGQALQLGLVGMAARASGVALDQRVGATGVYAEHPATLVTEEAGDCWARTRLRVEEIRRSLDWIEAAVERQPTWAGSRRSAGPLARSTLVVALCEGWRGEIVHCLETDADGSLAHYKVQDPSLRNWLGLAIAVRENEISDFPICNKSFDLSYCGNDL